VEDRRCPPGRNGAAEGAPWVNAMAEPPARGPLPRPRSRRGARSARSRGPGLERPGRRARLREGELAPLGGVSLAGLRPAREARGFAPEPEPDVVILSSFDGPRPARVPRASARGARGARCERRPAEALAEPEPEPEAPARPDLQQTLAAIVEGAPDPLAGATRLAVASARVPEGRPNNFGRVVQAQLDRASRASGGGGGGASGGVAWARRTSSATRRRKRARPRWLAGPQPKPAARRRTPWRPRRPSPTPWHCARST
jgi:hypothetical protein